MARLTDMLRNAQTTCTDAECFTGPCKNRHRCCFSPTGWLDVLVPGAQNTGGGTGVNHMFLMLMMWLAIAFLLFFFRPRALRPGREQQGKPSDQVRKLITKRCVSIVFSFRVPVLINKNRPSPEFTRQSMREKKHFVSLQFIFRSFFLARLSAWVIFFSPISVHPNNSGLSCKYFDTMAINHDQGRSFSLRFSIHALISLNHLVVLFLLHRRTVDWHLRIQLL